MKILCLSDIHGRFGLYRPETLPDADVVIVAGDLTNWWRIREAVTCDWPHAGCDDSEVW